MTSFSRSFSVWAFCFVAVLVLGPAPAWAGVETFELSIKDHRFEPSQLRIPVDTKVKIVVRNLDPTPEEFESYELNREKIVSGGSSIIIFVGPLKAGSYPFFGEFNQDTAQGHIVVE